jgi:hypothetical protein
MPLRYNSLDRPVCQVEQRLLRQRSSTKVNSEREQCADSTRRVRAAPEGAPDSEQCCPDRVRAKPPQEKDNDQGGDVNDQDKEDDQGPRPPHPRVH